MAFTVRIEGPEAEALERQARAEDRSVEDLVPAVLSQHVARQAPAELAQVEAARSDDELTSRVARLVERDREILDRLAE
jgi:hypothetical protein